MSAEDRNGEVSTDEKCIDCSTKERSFDELTRGLASASVSRRGALRLLAGALFGGVLASVPGVGRIAGNNGEAQAEECANQGQSCTAQKCCAGLNCLIDQTNSTEKFCCSPLSTLVCGRSCCPTGALGNCSAGKCVCPTGEIVCPDANNLLAGKCVNLLEDPDNCGQCGVVCPGPSGLDAPCRVRACVNGTCTTVANPNANGLTCEDGNLCTVGDTCNNGTCQPGTPVDCSHLDTQCTEGFCNQQTGTCDVRNRPDGSSCDDDNPCTENDRCQSGVCVGTPITGCVRCSSAADCPTPSNQCQRAVCTAAGICGVENKPNGTGCNDNNPCTTNDVCTAGVCAGTPRTCSPGEVCCPAGSSQGAGSCKKAAGAACTRNNQCCNACVGGVCT